MAPFNVTYKGVPDGRVSDLLAATNAIGLPTPTLTPATGAAGSTIPDAGSRLSDPLDGAADLPSSWHLVREIEGQSYRWPEYREQYMEYRVYAGESAREGTVHIALGTALRPNTWGRDRSYVIAFLTSSSPQTALVEFLETDDYETTSEYIAVIRGRDGAESKKMFGPADSLPPVYADHFTTVLYSDHIRVQGSWSKIGVLAREDDPDTMLNHALLQARRRGDL